MPAPEVPTPEVSEAGGDVVVSVHVVPRAGRPGPAGLHDGALRLRVAAPPERGRATEEARRLLAGLLGVPVGRVLLESGRSSRRKRFRVAGLDVAAARARLGEQAGGRAGAAG